MKYTILLLALCASALAMQNLSSLSDEKTYYGNPWVAGQEDPQCASYERTDKWQDPNYNIEYATCMPVQQGNGGQCPRSKNYNKGCDAYATTNTHDTRWQHDKHFCVEECSYDHDSCPTGAECRPAPEYLQNTEGTVKNMCAYPKTTPPPPPPVDSTNYYESPWLKNGACNKKDYKNRYFNETAYNHTAADGTVYGICTPVQEGDLSSCPVPPNFQHGLDAYNSNGNCFLECSSGASLCPNGSVCITAPEDAITPTSRSYMKNICVFAKTNTVRLNMAYFQ